MSLDRIACQLVCVPEECKPPECRQHAPYSQVPHRVQGVCSNDQYTAVEFSGKTSVWSNSEHLYIFFILTLEWKFFLLLGKNHWNQMALKRNVESLQRRWYLQVRIWVWCWLFPESSFRRLRFKPLEALILFVYLSLSSILTQRNRLSEKVTWAEINHKNKLLAIKFSIIFRPNLIEVQVLLIKGL